MYGFEGCHEEILKPLLMSLEMLEKDCFTFWGTKMSFLKSWKIFCMIALSICHYNTLIAYIVKIFTEGINPFENADMLPLWLSTTQTWIELVILMMKRDDIRKVIIHIGSIWRIDDLNEEQLKMKKAVLKRLYYGGIAFNKGVLAVSWQYLLVPICETVARRLIFNQDVEFKLPFACVYPFEIKNWLVYLAVYYFQVYSIFRSVYIFQGVGWLLIVLTQLVHVQFLLLQEDLIKIKPEVIKRKSEKLVCDPNELLENDEFSDLRLDEFVRRHQDALLLADKLSRACSKLTFSRMLFATLVICFFAVAAKASKGAAYAFNNYGVIFVIMLCIFILCYSSQQLSSSSSGIALAASKTLWYKGSLRYQTSIGIIIMRAQKPCSLTLLDFTPLGLDTFNKVVKTTWSYFSLANQMYDKRD